MQVFELDLVKKIIHGSTIADHIAGCGTVRVQLKTVLRRKETFCRRSPRGGGGGGALVNTLRTVNEELKTGAVQEKISTKDE